MEKSIGVRVPSLVPISGGSCAFAEYLSTFAKRSPALLVASIKNVSGVLDVHDLHVWTIGSDLIASSCHLLVKEQSGSDCKAVLKSVAHELEHRHGINHSTIQVEVEGCEAEHPLCSQQPEDRAGTVHQH